MLSFTHMHTPPNNQSLTLSEIQKLSLQLPNFAQKAITTFDINDLKALVTAYFTDCIKTQRLPTMTGLALALGTTRNDLLSAFNSDHEINHIISVAKQTVVQFVESLLLSGRPPVGLIFWLKNNDSWIDKNEIVHANKSMAEILDELEKSNTIINANNPLNQVINQPDVGNPTLQDIAIESINDEDIPVDEFNSPNFADSLPFAG